MDTILTSGAPMSKKTSCHLAARCNQELADRIQVWCKENKISQSQLIIRAVEKYISEDQTLKAVVATDDEAMAAAEKAMKDHAHTLEKLK